MADKDRIDSVTLCMEDKLRSLGILGRSDDKLSSTTDPKILKGINLDTSTPQKKVYLLDRVSACVYYIDLYIII